VRRRPLILLIGAAVTVYALDQVTKSLAEHHLQDRPPLELIQGILDLRFVTNPGGAFGLFGGSTWLFVAASFLVIGVILLIARKVPSASVAVSLGLVLGGAVGNLTDRALRGPGFSGRVVDFIDLQVWPVFNLADAAIVTGAALMLITGFRRERARRPSAQPPSG
jgi:signal peptidase II